LSNRQSVGKTKIFCRNCHPDQGFNQLCYSSDGEYLLAGGKSFLVVMYSVRARHVIGTFILSQNINIDGLQEFLNAKNTMTEFGALAEIDDDEQVKIAGQKKKDRAIRRVEVLFKNLKKREAKLRVKNRNSGYFDAKLCFIQNLISDCLRMIFRPVVNLCVGKNKIYFHVTEAKNAKRSFASIS
jgi:hypothetical protein